MIDDDERPAPAGWPPSWAPRSGPAPRSWRGAWCRVQRPARPVGRGRTLPHPAELPDRDAARRGRRGEPAARRPPGRRAGPAVRRRGRALRRRGHALQPAAAREGGPARLVRGVDRPRPGAPERMTRRWVLARAMSHGDAWVRIGLRLEPGPAARAAFRARWGVGGAVRVVGGGGRFVAGALLRRPVDSARGLRAAMRGVGMVRGCVGAAPRRVRPRGQRCRW